MSRLLERPIEYDEQVLSEAIAGQITLSRLNRKISCRLSPAIRQRFDEAVERGYCNAATVQESVANCFGFWCKAHKRPTLILRRDRKRLLVTLDMDSAPWRFDLDADLRARAILGMPLDTRFNGVLVHPLSLYHSINLPWTDAERIAGELAALVKGGEPWGVDREAACEYNGMRCRRPVDWSTLIPLWESRIRGPKVERAIRTGHFIASNVNETREWCAYRDYCDVAGRPRLYIRIRRGRADIELEPSRRIPLTISAAMITTVETLVGHTGMAEDSYVHASPGYSEMIVTGVPADMAETVAFRIYELALDCTTGSSR